MYILVRVTRFYNRVVVCQSERPDLLSVQVYASTFHNCRANLGHVCLVVWPVDSWQASIHSSAVLSFTLVYRLPMYYTAKVAFVVYLWHPKTQGAISLYTHTVQPLLRQNEALIDQYFEGGKAWAFDALAANFRW